MDSRIWSRLPQRLIDRVIAFLPPPAFFRARAVCKRWSNTGPDNANGRPNCEGYLFDPYNVAWYILSFALIPPGFSPASSSGGLICWVSDEAGSKSLLLCNPLVGSLTPLPSTLRPRLFPSIGLTVTNSSIDIAVAGDDLISPYAVKNLTTESFHIDGGGFYSIWGTTSSLPRLCSLESGGMVYVEGKFYCMNDSPFSVLAYDIAANNWCKIQAPMRRFLRCPSLVESRGKLIMIAAVEKSKLNVPKSLRLWGLQSCGTMWVEIERMPQQLYIQFAEVEGGRGFNCVGSGEFIVIMIRGRGSDKALLFDFYRKRWVWIPPCAYVNGGGEGEGELHGFAYEPRLATPAVTGLLDQLTLPFQSFNG
ncbi:hypothetical protein F0562_019577 [Nyssa sinensis]|uniref:F-box domain-containing protein n=1 Tax=Nyssa sinensis TaxID=561372 RepID=A0A5J5BPE0_9ASTE|nr:hypothetical protein F0562_019577 [Nyssa sinensis]